MSAYDPRRWRPQDYAAAFWMASVIAAFTLAGFILGWAAQ